MVVRDGHAQSVGAETLLDQRFACGRGHLLKQVAGSVRECGAKP
jgi:hypothetical protein